MSEDRPKETLRGFVFGYLLDTYFNLFISSSCGQKVQSFGQAISTNIHKLLSETCFHIFLFLGHSSSSHRFKFIEIINFGSGRALSRHLGHTPAHCHPMDGLVSSTLFYFVIKMELLCASVGLNHTVCLIYRFSPHCARPSVAHAFKLTMQTENVDNKHFSSCEL